VKPGKTGVGAISIFYNMVPATAGVLPTAEGVYAVTFNVAPTTTYNGLSGIHAGVIVISGRGEETRVTPTLQSDFIITIQNSAVPPVPLTGTDDKLEAPYENKDLSIKIEAKPGKTYPINFAGTEYPNRPINTRIRYWKEANPGVYSDMVEAPQDAGNYKVEIVLDAVVWVTPNNQAWDNLTFKLPFEIKKRVPSANDFVYSKQSQSEKGKFQGVDIIPQDLGITPKATFTTAGTGSLAGGEGTAYTITRRYAGKGDTVYPPTDGSRTATQVPIDAGTYTVTFAFGFPLGGSTASANWEINPEIQADDLELLPMKPVKPEVDFNDPDALFWVDRGVLKASQPQIFINPPLGYAVCSFTKDPRYDVVEWREDGKVIYNDDGTKFTGTSYTFNGSTPPSKPNTAIGRHWVTLVVKDANGLHYTEDVIVMVQTPRQ